MNFPIINKRSAVDKFPKHFRRQFERWLSVGVRRRSKGYNGHSFTCTNPIRYPTKTYRVAVQNYAIIMVKLPRNLNQLLNVKHRVRNFMTVLLLFRSGRARDVGREKERWRFSPKIPWTWTQNLICFSAPNWNLMSFSYQRKPMEKPLSCAASEATMKEQNYGW